MGAIVVRRNEQRENAMNRLPSLSAHPPNPPFQPARVDVWHPFFGFIPRGRLNGGVRQTSLSLYYWQGWFLSVFHSLRRFIMKTRNTSRFTFVAILLFLSYPTYGYDRRGSDIDNPKVSTPTECAALCDGNPSCQSWTFVKPPIKHPTSAVCFLKNAVPTPEFNPTCPSNTECKSGVKDGRGQWCGESNKVSYSGIFYNQGDVVSCLAGRKCGPLVTPKKLVPWWCPFVFWIPSVCDSGVETKTLEHFCQ